MLPLLIYRIDTFFNINGGLLLMVGCVVTELMEYRRLFIYIVEILGITGNQGWQVIFKNNDKSDCRRSNLEQLTMSDFVSGR